MPAVVVHYTISKLTYVVVEELLSRMAKWLAVTEFHTMYTLKYVVIIE